MLVVQGLYFSLAPGWRPVLERTIGLLLGYPYRIIDINDAPLNALGVLIGYGLFRLFAWVYIAGVGHLGVPRWGLPAYIYQVSQQA